MKPRSKKDRRSLASEVLNDRVWTPWTIFWFVVILGVLTLTFWSVYRVWAPPHGVYRDEYQGRIVDRWAQYSESEQGSTPQFKLLVEGDDRNRFTVSVSPEIYERSKVGMRVKKNRNSGIVLTPEALAR